MSELLVDWCSTEAARYACERWHYTGTIPPVKNVNLGVWEGEKFKGVVLFGRAANPSPGLGLDLGPAEWTELKRIALRSHDHPVSQIGAIALKMLKRKDPGLKVVVSYADPLQGHLGTIYQAMNWIYLGQTDGARVGRARGSSEWWHSRGINMRIAEGNIDHDDIVEWRKTPGKFKYVYPLEDDIEERIKPMAQEYPTDEELELEVASS